MRKRTFSIKSGEENFNPKNKKFDNQKSQKVEKAETWHGSKWRK